MPTAVLLLLIGTVLMALAMTAVWAAGGFTHRESLVNAQPGEPLDLGPVTVTLHTAVTAYSSVHVAATCELTGNTGSSSGHAVSEATLAAVRIDDVPTDSEHTLLTFGVDRETDQVTSTRDVLSPGLQPMPCLFKFNFPPGQIGDKVVVALLRLEYVDLSNVRNDKTENRAWEVGSGGYVLELPITAAR